MMFLAQMAGLREAWTDQTILNPLGFAALLALGTAMLLVPRRYAVVPIIIMACLIAPGQRIYVMGMNFTLLRLMVVFGWIRVLARREGEGFQWCILDYLMIAWAVVGTIMFVMLWGTFDSLIERSGEVYDALGMYFLFRCLVRNWEDIDTSVKWFVIIKDNGIRWRYTCATTLRRRCLVNFVKIVKIVPASF